MSGTYILGKEAAGASIKGNGSFACPEGAVGRARDLQMLQGASPHSLKVVPARHLAIGELVKPRPKPQSIQWRQSRHTPFDPGGSRTHMNLGSARGSAGVGSAGVATLTDQVKAMKQSK